MTQPPPYGQEPGAPPPQDPYQQPPPYPQPPPAYPPQPPPAYPQPPTFQVSGPPTYPISGGGQPYSPYPPPYPGGPMGFDPVTGQPYSDKSKLAAGLLQLLPGFFLGIGGIGRLYAGYTTIGVMQLVVTVLAYVSACCSIVTFGLALVFAIPLGIAAWLWPVIDGIVLLAGRPADAQGRPLRP